MPINEVDTVIILLTSLIGTKPSAGAAIPLVRLPRRPGFFCFCATGCPRASRMMKTQPECLAFFRIAPVVIQPNGHRRFATWK